MFFLLYSDTYSQKIKHSVGGTVIVLGAHVKTPLRGTVFYREYSFIMEEVALTYFPRINFETGNNTAFSIGIPVAVGAGIASDANNDNSGVYFSYDVSAIADYNIGKGATETTEKRFGYFLGAGFSYGYVNLALTTDLNKISSYGPLIHAGARFGIGSSHGITTGLYYKFGLESMKFTTVGIQVLADL